MIEQHFTATGIVFSDEGSVLMIKHRKLGVWLPPGGHVEPNELPDDAVLREIFEETGVVARLLPARRGLRIDCELVTPFAVVLEDIRGDGTHNHIDLIYLCRASEQRLRACDAETDGAGWFMPEQAAGLHTYENVRETVRLAAQAVAEGLFG